jgi:hypothetical protein
LAPDAAEVEAEVELEPLLLADEDDEDDELLPHPAIAAPQSSATGAASQLLLVRIANSFFSRHPEPGRSISNKSFTGANL